MSTAVSELLTAAMKLGESERNELAERIWDTLDGPDFPTDNLTEEEFEREILSRREEALKDPSSLMTWEQVRAMP